VGIEPLTFCVQMLIFIRFLDTRSDAEGARSSSFFDLPEERTAFGHRGEVFGSGTLHCAVPPRSPGVIASVIVTRYTVTRYDLGEYNGSC
jgi:hypothetical protein